MFLPVGFLVDVGIVVVVSITVVVVLFFFFVKMTVVGTTIAVITKILIMILNIIHNNFFLRIIPFLKIESIFYYTSWIAIVTYSVVVVGESDTTYASPAIDRYCYTKLRNGYSFF